MTNPVVTNKPATARSLLILAALAPVMAIGGCSWFSDDGPPPLPGERIAVLQNQRAIDADPDLASEDVVLPRPQAVADWPQSGGYPDHAMHHLALADVPKQVYRVSIGDGSSRARNLTATPVVGDGRLFTLDASGLVSSFDARSGSKQWSVDVTTEDEQDMVSPGGVAYAGGRLFVATGIGQVIALDATTGKEIWRQQQSAPMHAAPTVSGERVFVVTIDNQLVALSAQDGRRLWVFGGVAETASLLGRASPAVDGGIVVAPFSSGEVTALRVETGRVVWTDALVATRRSDAVSALADVRGVPVIDRGVVYAISHSGRLAAIDLRSGNRLWDKEIAGRSQPWIAGDWLYIVSVTGEVYCLSRSDGRVRWSQTLPDYENPEKKRNPIFWFGPVLAGDRLIVTGSNEQAMSISPYTGAILGRIDLPARSLVPPIVAGETLYILSDDGDVIAMR